MLYVTGKIKQGLFHTVAYKLYDSRLKESTIMSREDIIDSVKKGRRIIGIKQNEYTGRVTINPEISNIKQLSCLNKDGTRVSFKNTLILIEVFTYADITEIVCIDAEDNFYLLDFQAIKTFLEHDYIIGLKGIEQNSILYYPEYDNKDYINTLILMKPSKLA